MPCFNWQNLMNLVPTMWLKRKSTNERLTKAGLVDQMPQWLRKSKPSPSSFFWGTVMLILDWTSFCSSILLDEIVMFLLSLSSLLFLFTHVLCCLWVWIPYYFEHRLCMWTIYLFNDVKKGNSFIHLADYKSWAWW